MNDEEKEMLTQQKNELIMEKKELQAEVDRLWIFELEHHNEKKLSKDLLSNIVNLKWKLTKSEEEWK